LVLLVLSEPLSLLVLLTFKISLFLLAGTVFTEPPFYLDAHAAITMIAGHVHRLVFLWHSTFITNPDEFDHKVTRGKDNGVYNAIFLNK
jgi:hypothetical protein